MVRRIDRHLNEDGVEVHCHIAQVSCRMFTDTLDQSISRHTCSTEVRQWLETYSRYANLPTVSPPVYTGPSRHSVPDTSAT